MGDAHAAKNTVLKIPGASVAFSDEPMSLIAGTGGTLWQITDKSKDLWEPTVEIDVGEDTDIDSILDPGEEIADANFSVQYLFGAVTFDTDRSGQTILASGSYRPHYYLDLGQSVTWTDGYNTMDAAAFFDTGPRTILGQRTLEATVEHVDTEFLPLDGSGGSEKTLRDIIGDRDRLALEYGPMGTDDGTASGTRRGRVRRAWVKISEQNLDASLTSLVGSELSFSLHTVEAANTGETASTIDYFDY